MSINSLPSEVLDRILLECDPLDVDRFARTSRFAREQVYGPANENHLWHSIFLNHFDRPIPNSPNQQPAMGRGGEIEGEEISSKTPADTHHHLPTAWRKTVQDRIKLRQTLTADDDESLKARLTKHYPTTRFSQIYETIFEILAQSRSEPYPSSFIPANQLTSKSLNIAFLQSILSSPPAQFRVILYSGQTTQSQPLFALRPTLKCPLVSAAAKLHTLYGLTHFDLTRLRTRGIARESCYALANYHPGNFYGPFMPDGSGNVNWAHLEALSVVVGLNLTLAKKRIESGSAPADQLGMAPLNLPHGTTQSVSSTTASWTHLRWPILDGLVAARSFTQIMDPAYEHPAYDWDSEYMKLERPIDLNHYDWAGVQGKWLRVVCFLDYRDLHAYNFHRNDERPKLDSHEEAIRWMTLDLKVISIGERPSNDPTHPIPPKLRTSRPPIWFRGTSAATTSPVVGHPLATVRGCVSSTTEDEVRWSVVSTANGNDRWSSEGVQVGGIRSRWGILGVWTDVDRNDVEGPAGPFYFFKTSY